MAYRAHLVVFYDGKRVNVRALKALRALDAHGQPAPIARAGTRYGTPGLWVEAEGKARFEVAVRTVIGKLLDRGMRVKVYATNIPSMAVVGELRFIYADGVISIQRG